MVFLIKNFFVFLLIFSLSSVVYSNAFQLKQIASGLGVPWSMVFISNDEILFTERKGRAGVLNIQSVFESVMIKSCQSFNTRSSMCALASVVAP